MFEVLKDYCNPVRGTRRSAYVDLFSADDVTIGAGETKIVKLGIKIDLSEIKDDFMVGRMDLNPYFMEYVLDENKYEHFLKSHYLEVALRNSLGVKGLIIANGIGIIDLDYPDEIGLIVHNPQNIKLFRREFSGEKLIENSKEPFEIKKGDKVAQACLKEHKSYLLGYETETIRTGGYGSTDK